MVVVTAIVMVNGSYMPNTVELFLGMVPLYPPLPSCDLGAITSHFIIKDLRLKVVK